MPSVPPNLLRALATLLDEALELGPAARVAWLERVRAVDPRHAEEVERLLDAEGRLDAEQFLELGPWVRAELHPMASPPRRAEG
jgi:hypothetical protein